MRCTMAEPEPGPALLGGVERVEDVRQVLRRDPRPRCRSPAPPPAACRAPPSSGSSRRRASPRRRWPAGSRAPARAGGGRRRSRELVPAPRPASSTGGCGSLRKSVTVESITSSQRDRLELGGAGRANCRKSVTSALSRSASRSTIPISRCSSSVKALLPPSSWMLPVIEASGLRSSCASPAAIAAHRRQPLRALHRLLHRADGR